MTHDINSALERLEKNLSELDSARSQVLQSVNASNDLLKMVTQYVTAVKKLAASLEEWESSLSGRESELHGEFGSAITSIKQTCTDIISAFKLDVNKATLDFKKDTDKNRMTNLLKELLNWLLCVNKSRKQRKKLKA